MPQLTANELNAINGLRTIRKNSLLFHMVQRYVNGTAEEQQELIRTTIAQCRECPSYMRGELGIATYEAVMKCRAEYQAMAVAA